jgi:hypothetical protein
LKASAKATGLPELKAWFNLSSNSWSVAGLPGRTQSEGLSGLFSCGSMEVTPLMALKTTSGSETNWVSSMVMVYVRMVNYVTSDMGNVINKNKDFLGTSLDVIDHIFYHILPITYHLLNHSFTMINSNEFNKTCMQTVQNNISFEMDSFSYPISLRIFLANGRKCFEVVVDKIELFQQRLNYFFGSILCFVVPKPILNFKKTYFKLVRKLVRFSSHLVFGLGFRWFSLFKNNSLVVVPEAIEWFIYHSIYLGGTGKPSIPIGIRLKLPSSSYMLGSKMVSSSIVSAMEVTPLMALKTTSGSETNFVSSMVMVYLRMISSDK